MAEKEPNTRVRDVSKWISQSVEDLLRTPCGKDGDGCVVTKAGSKEKARTLLRYSRALLEGFPEADQLRTLEAVVKPCLINRTDKG